LVIAEKTDAAALMSGLPFGRCRRKCRRLVFIHREADADRKANDGMLTGTNTIEQWVQVNEADKILISLYNRFGSVGQALAT
jgi:hypothetical protein